MCAGPFRKAVEKTYQQAADMQDQRLLEINHPAAHPAASVVREEHGGTFAVHSGALVLETPCLMVLIFEDHRLVC